MQSVHYRILRSHKDTLHDAFIKNLENAIAVGKYGSGYEKDTHTNGYVTESITTAVNAAESFLTAEELKLKHAYDNGATDNGWSYEEMGNALINRVQEAIDNPYHNDWNVITNDFGALSQQVQLEELQEIKDALEDAYNVDTSIVDQAITNKTNGSSGSSGNKTAGQKTQDKYGMSDKDKQAIADAQKKYNEATTQAEKDAAHKEAEAIRNKYGYSGGDDGSKDIVTSNKSVVSSNKDHTVAVVDNTDSNYDVADSNKEVAASNEKLSENGIPVDVSVDVNVNGGSGTGTPTNKGTGGGKTLTDPFNGNKSYVDDNGNTHTKGSDGLIHVTDSKGKVVGKYAKGGTNIPAGIANIDEEGAELIAKPDKGRIIEFEYDGNTVFDANTTANIMRFANDPDTFIGSYMNRNQNQVVYTAGGTTNYNYEIANVSLPNVTKPDEFWNGLMQNIHNEAAQWASMR